MKKTRKPRDHGLPQYKPGGGTWLVLQLLKRNKGKIVTGSQIDEMLSRHGKASNYHAIQRLIIDGYAKRIGAGRYTYFEPGKRAARSSEK